MAVRHIVMVLSGALLGIFVSWITNSTLMEVSINTFFAFYFGILFLLIGGVILWRVHTLLGAEPGRSMAQLFIFGALILMSGILCFMLDEELVRMSPVVKVPMYAVLGTSVAFAFSFSVVDMINACSSACDTGPTTGPQGRRTIVGIVDTPAQVNLVLVTSAVLGFLYGFVFGVLDVEDYRGAALRDILREDELYFCYPVGILVGGLAGYVNERFREEEQLRSTRFVRAPQQEFDEDTLFDDDDEVF